jgi:hypothetical protein
MYTFYTSLALIILGLIIQHLSSLMMNNNDKVLK